VHTQRRAATKHIGCCDVGKQVLRVLWFCMSYGNSCANPIIYNYASTDFRAGFRRAVYRLLVCVPKPAGWEVTIADDGTTRYRDAGAANTLNTAVRMSPRPPTAVSAVRL